MEHFQFLPNDKLYFIYPHPDDETFFNAGLFQYLNKNKIDYKVLILTKGGASTLKRKIGKHTLKAKRQMEFYAAMKTLGVKYFEIEDFEDGGLSDQNEIEKYISKKIELYKPSHLVTFEPNGLYGHTDHVFISKLLTEIANKNKIKIIYSTITSEFKLDNGALRMSVLNPLPKHLEANFILKLSLLEWLKKLHAYYNYRSQFSFKKEFINNPFNFFLAKKEYYYFND